MAGGTKKPESGAEELMRLLREHDAAQPETRGWKPPTEDAFNHEWFTREDILTEVEGRLESFSEKRARAEELRAGVILAVARNAQIGARRESLIRVPMSAWEAASDSDLDHFWGRGQLIVRLGGVGGYGDGTTHRYLDIKFDPASLSGQGSLPEMPDDPTGQEVEADENSADLPNVDFEHLELWYAAFIAAYPSSSEALAIASARGAFPHHLVKRQWVRDLRGERPMGRPRKNKDK